MSVAGPAPVRREGGRAGPDWLRCDVTVLATWRRSPVSVSVWRGVSSSSSVIAGGQHHRLPLHPHPPLQAGPRSQAGAITTQQIQLEVRRQRADFSSQCYCCCCWRGRGRNNNYQSIGWTTTSHSSDVSLLPYFLLVRLIISTHWGRKFSF